RRSRSCKSICRQQRGWPSKRVLSANGTRRERGERRTVAHISDLRIGGTKHRLAALLDARQFALCRDSLVIFVCAPDYVVKLAIGLRQSPDDLVGTGRSVAPLA